MSPRLLPALLALLFAVPAAAAPPAPDAVMVIGALHELHAREPSFDFGALRAAIAAFEPDVLVLEVRPDELAGRTATPGRPEYPAVVWPLLAVSHAQAVAMEPGGATFTTLSGAAGSAYKAFNMRDPGVQAALSAAEAAVADMLIAYWRRPGQSQDATTAAVSNGLQAIQVAFLGAQFASVQARWDDYMAGIAVAAVRANPGKRVLVLGSYRNRAHLASALRDVAPERTIAAATWLDEMEP